MHAATNIYVDNRSPLASFWQFTDLPLLLGHLLPLYNNQMFHMSARNDSRCFGLVLRSVPLSSLALYALYSQYQQHIGIEVCKYMVHRQYAITGNDSYHCERRLQPDEVYCKSVEGVPLADVCESKMQLS